MANPSQGGDAKLEGPNSIPGEGQPVAESSKANGKANTKPIPGNILGMGFFIEGIIYGTSVASEHKLEPEIIPSYNLKMPVTRDHLRIVKQLSILDFKFKQSAAKRSRKEVRGRKRGFAQLRA